MNKEYKKMLENALRFHKTNKDKKNIAIVEDLIKRCKNGNKH